MQKGLKGSKDHQIKINRHTFLYIKYLLFFAVYRFMVVNDKSFFIFVVFVQSFLELLKISGVFGWKFF